MKVNREQSGLNFDKVFWSKMSIDLCDVCFMKAINPAVTSYTGWNETENWIVLHIVMKIYVDAQKTYRMKFIDEISIMNLSTIDFSTIDCKIDS